LVLRHEVLCAHVTMRPRRPALSSSSLGLRPVHTNWFCPLSPLSFQSLTTIKFSKPFVLITIRNARGCGYPPDPLRETLTPLISDPVSSNSVPRVGHNAACADAALFCFSNLQHSTSRSNSYGPVRSQRGLALSSLLSSLESTLAKVYENKRLYLPLESTLTRKAG